MKPISKVGNLTADQLQEEIQRLLGTDEFMVMWHIKDEKQTAMLTNLPPANRLQLMAGYIMEEFKQNSTSVMGDLFETAAMGALARLLKERAQERARFLGVEMMGGSSDVPN